MISTRLSGHSLEREGAPHDGIDARISRPFPIEKGGNGRGKCSCGELSDVLPSKSARQRWHREHKADLRAQTTTTEGSDQ